MNSRLVSLKEAADLLSLGRTRLYEEVNTGRLRTIKVGSRRLVPDTELQVWIDARMAESQPDWHGENPCACGGRK